MGSGSAHPVLWLPDAYWYPRYIIFVSWSVIIFAFCSNKFVNQEVENSNEMLIKSVRELKRFPHLDGGFTSQYAPVGWEFAKICNDVKSNPHLGPGLGGRAQS